MIEENALRTPHWFIRTRHSQATRQQRVTPFSGLPSSLKIEKKVILISFVVMNMRQDGFPCQTLIQLPVETIKQAQQLPLARALYITDIGYFPDAKNHHMSRPEGCENHIFIYCTGGEGWCKIGDQSVTVGPQQAVLIGAKEPHSYGTKPGGSWHIHWIHFNGTESSGLMNRLKEDTRENLIYLPRPGPIIHAFEDSIRWTRRAHTTQSIIAMSGACAHLLSLVIEGKRSTAKRMRQVEERVHSTVGRMHESLRTPLTLDELAQDACLSIPHYSAVFKQKTGYTPMQIYTQIRIQHACELLSNTHLEIKTIAEESGYEDPFYFSRKFKHTMGVSPSEYRKKQQQHHSLVSQSMMRPMES